MKTRLILALVGLMTATTAHDLTKNHCHACIDGVCYGLTQSVPGDRLPAEDNSDNDNLMYFAYPNSYHIYALNLNDEYDVKIVLTADYPILGIALNQTSRDLYYSLENGDFFKYNLVTNQTVSILKPGNEESNSLGKKRPGFINFFISSNKLYATKNIYRPTRYFTATSLFEYVPEELQFKLRDRNMRFEQLYDEPIVDSQGNIYYQRSRQLYTLQGGENKTVLVYDSYLQPASKRVMVNEPSECWIDNVGRKFLHPDIRRLYRLDSRSTEMVLAGALEMPEIDCGPNKLIYVYSRMSYATANSDRCAIKDYYPSVIKIKKLPKNQNE